MPNNFSTIRAPHHYIRYLFLTALQLFLISATGPASARAEAANAAGKGFAIVYIVDNSSSMSWIFDDVKATLKDVVKASSSKESIAIILFGEKVTTLANYRSLDETKKKFLCDSIDSASPDSLYTCFVPAAKRGIQYLYEDYRNDVAEKYVLVFITDGKNHPPPDFVQEYTLEETLTQYPGFFPGRDWTICYVALKEQIDPDFLALVKKYNGQFYNTSELSKVLGVVEAKVVESIIEHPENWEELEASISDHFGNVEVKKKGEDRWGKVMEGFRWKLAAGDSVAVGEGSTAVISIGSLASIGLRENTHIELNKIEALPLKKRADIEIEMEQGTMWSKVNKKEEQSVSYQVLTPLALAGARGTAFRVAISSAGQEQTVSVFDGAVEVSPYTGQSQFTEISIEKGSELMVSSGKPPTPPSSIPDDLLREWEKWKKVFSMQTSLLHTHFEPVKVTPLVERVTLGPIKPRHKFTAQIPLKFSEKYRGQHMVTAKAMIELPVGARITTKVKEAEENKLQKNVDILLECEPFLRHISTREVQGNLKLGCEDRDVVFVRDTVALSIHQDPPGLVQKFISLAALIKALIAGSILLGFLLAVALGFNYRAQIRRWRRRLMSRMKDALLRTRLVRLYRGRPVGLLVLHTEVPGTNQKRFDLAEVSRQCNNVILGIGRDTTNSLCFAHSSLYPFHCLIYASRRRNPTDIYIEPRHDGPVSINGEPIKGSRQIHNRDKIDIGSLRFQFVDIQSQRQVKVHMNDGERHVGILEYWDIGAMVFYMTKVHEKREEFLTIDFRNVAYIEFYRDESDPEKNILPLALRKSGKKRRKNITVLLSNSTELHGIVDRKYRYREGAGILLLPKKKDKVQYIYAPWTSVESVEISLIEENGGAAS